MNNNGIIRDLIDEALEILQRMNIKYNTPPGQNTQALVQIVQELNSYICNVHPRIYKIQEYAISHIVYNRCINAYSFGDLRTTIRILDTLYPHTERKIFISHSSKDESIIKQFTKEILIAGCGLRPNEIFCTLDNSTIHTGEDFRNEIVRGMKECDFILLMISNNYKESEVCQNEMGAAWALDNKTVLPFVLPDCRFEDMGFVYNVKQGAMIMDKTKLDELYRDICETYDIEQDWIHFNQISNEFIEIVNKLTPTIKKGTKAKETSKEIMDSLSDFDKKRLLEWVKSGESSASCTTTADGTFYELGTVVYPINTGREKSEFADFIERLKKINFVKFTGSDDFSYYYELKKAAYDYVDKMGKIIEE